MLVVSDNTATNLLIDRLGLDEISATASSLGLTQTVRGRRVMDFVARAAGRDNYMSAADAALILTRLVQEATGVSPVGEECGARLSPALATELLAILEKEQFKPQAVGTASAAQVRPQDRGTARVGARRRGDLRRGDLPASRRGEGCRHRSSSGDCSGGER